MNKMAIHTHVIFRPHNREQGIVSQAILYGSRVPVLERERNVLFNDILNTF